MLQTPIFRTQTKREKFATVPQKQLYSMRRCFKVILHMIFKTFVINVKNFSEGGKDIVSSKSSKIA